MNSQVFAVVNDQSIALGVAMFSLVWSGVVAGLDRYSASALKRRQDEIRLAVDISTNDCKDRLAEKDRQIERLEQRSMAQGSRITELERENERLVVTCDALKAEIQRFSSQSNAKS